MSAQDDPIWISKPAAPSMHSSQLAEHGGADGVRDEGLLDSALARPRHQFAYGGQTTSDIHALAAGYAFGIAKNHPFIDGNKRTALMVSVTFMMLNGWWPTFSEPEAAIYFKALAAGELTEAQLAEFFRTGSKRAD